MPNSSNSWALLSLLVVVSFGLGNVCQWWLSHRLAKRQTVASETATSLLQEHERDRRAARHAGFRVGYSITGGRPPAGAPPSGRLALSLINWFNTEQDVIVVAGGLRVSGDGLTENAHAQLERDLTADLGPATTLVVQRTKDTRVRVVDRAGGQATLSALVRRLHALGVECVTLCGWVRDIDGIIYDQPDPATYRVDKEWLDGA
jgi:hypothetical protein